MNIYTKTMITSDLLKLGVNKNDNILIHASMKKIGWLVGGPIILIEALNEIVGKYGSIMMYVGWEDGPYTMEDWPEEKKMLYQKECPGYNKKKSRAVCDWGILGEIFRTYPSTIRSNHPDGSFCSIGKNARFLMKDHSFIYGYGEKSPLAKLVKLNGKVLMIGAPFTSMTLLHHAESICNVKNKKIIKYKMPIEKRKKTKWVDIIEYDTNIPIINKYKEDYFNNIIEDYCAEKEINHGIIGDSVTYYFNSKDVIKYAVKWLEKNQET